MLRWVAMYVTAQLCIEGHHVWCCAGSEAKVSFLKSSHDVLQPAVLRLFRSSSAAGGEAASSTLLPALIAVAEQLGLACERQLASALWKAAR